MVELKVIEVEKDPDKRVNGEPKASEDVGNKNYSLTIARLRNPGRTTLFGGPSGACRGDL